MPDRATVKVHTADDRRLPPLGIGLWIDRMEPRATIVEQLDQLRPHHVDMLVDLQQTGILDCLDEALSVCHRKELPIWLYVIAPDVQPGAALRSLAYRINSHSAAVAGMLLTPAAYLASYQPDGDWPTTISPAELLSLGREIWPTLRLGGGFPTYFTELNRCRPEPAGIDFLTHATSPIVHAADDVSVIQTLESLPYVFESARRLAPARLYRVTTSAIGAWTNPYGRTLTPNADGERRTLSDNDPRQRALFAAAWSLGYMAQATGRVDALTLSSIGRPFPITDTAHRYPIFDVLRGLTRGSGRIALRTTADNPALTVLGWNAPDGASEVWLANLGNQHLDVRVEGARTAAVLDDRIVMATVGPDEWLLDRLDAVNGDALRLGPYAVARVEISGA